jgi:hypothetical protein
VRREKALDFSGRNSRPGTGSLHPPLLRSTTSGQNGKSTDSDSLLYPFDEAAASAFERRGLLYAPEWRTCAENIARIDIFNLASVNEFLGYATRLENLLDGANRIQGKKSKQLPWYTYDVWLPFDFEPTPQPEISDGHWPVPLLSSHRLLIELNEIQRLSALGLGDVPIGYELMRSNPKEFYKSKITLDNTTLMRWIWKGLHDAAELSIANSAPVFAAE